MSTKVIDINELKSRKHANERLDSDEFIIDMRKKHDELYMAVDELWNEIYTGKRIKEMFADDDGVIRYVTETPKFQYELYDKKVLFEHIKFLMKFINRTGFLHLDCLKEYKEFIAENDYPEIITQKENT